jgi:hypothetical protein
LEAHFVVHHVVSGHHRTRDGKADVDTTPTSQDVAPEPASIIEHSPPKSEPLSLAPCIDADDTITGQAAVVKSN